LEYIPNANLPECYIFDIDGTIAENVSRSPYEWLRVEEDKPHMDVIRILQELGEWSSIILLSGRDAVCRKHTERWLNKHGVSYTALHMRPEGNNIKDSALKHDLFHEHVAPFYNVRGVFDDRQQVVDVWRKMGLRCYQVAPGDF
jgi:hypothetical protein